MSENTEYLRKSNRLFFSAIILSILSVISFSCASVKTPLEDYTYISEAEDITGNPYIFRIKPGNRDFTMTVLGDLHGYDSDTLVNDYQAWNSYLKITKKVFDDNFENTRFALDRAAGSEADFIVIPGDLTVNGDKASHILLAEILLDFEKSGIQAYVVPGNHDVKNSKGLQFLKNKPRHAKNISAKDFSEIYGEFGYREAFSRDKTSLSYAVEPLPGLVLLCLDTAQWKRNRGFPFRVTPPDGHISGDTIKWADNILYNAEKKGKNVFAVQHHPVDDEFADYDEAIEFYKKHDIRLIITGHNHRYKIRYADSLPMLISPNLSSGPDNTLEVEISGSRASSLLNPYNFPD